MDLSFQLYSAREFTPWKGVVKTLADLGYTQVEGFGGVYDDPKAFRDLLEEHGLSMPSGHFAIPMLEDDFEKALMIAQALGMKQIYGPFLAAANRPADLDGWKAFADRLKAIGQKLQDKGFAFGWHNHDFEFQALDDGSIPMAVLLDQAEDLYWEADIAWVVSGGADPIEWINRYGSRINAVHVKDIAAEGECRNEDGWADVGHGTIDWPEIMKALKQSGNELFIVEHDKPSDATRFARRSIESIRNFAA